MVPISHPVRRSVVTNVAGSVDATLTGNGGTPIAAADIVGGLSTKTIAFAAGETLKNATWDIVDDAAVEGTEGYKVTLSNPQPSGTLSVPSITGTVLDNTTGGGGGGGTGGDTVVYPMQTTGNTGYVEAGNGKVRIDGTLSNQVLGFSFGSNAGGSDRIEVYHDGFRAIKVRSWTDGTAANVDAPFSLADSDTDLPANSSFSITHDPVAGTITFVVAGRTRMNAFGYGTPKTGASARAEFNGGGTARITRLAA